MKFTLIVALIGCAFYCIARICGVSNDTAIWGSLLMLSLVFCFSISFNLCKIHIEIKKLKKLRREQFKARQK